MGLKDAYRTPILTCAGLNALAGGKLFFKCENFQKVGAFKFRGACNAVLSLPEEEAAKGVATHSSGNHAAALAGRRFDDLSVDQGVKPAGLDIMLLPKQLIRQGAEIGQNWG